MRWSVERMSRKKKIELPYQRELSDAVGNYVSAAFSGNGQEVDGVLARGFNGYGDFGIAYWSTSHDQAVPAFIPLAAELITSVESDDDQTIIEAEYPGKIDPLSKKEVAHVQKLLRGKNVRII